MKKTIIPPIKTQGIKTKLIPFIQNTIKFNPQTQRWVEPFLGSGVVLFNIQPKDALICDTNIHIINIYKSIQNKTLTPELLRSYLEKEGATLSEMGVEHYKFIRERFNKNHDIYDFIFLNRSCFNGLMRFNSKGGFNVPFCKKPNRFNKSLITKICNQVKNIQEIIKPNWEFKAQSWEDTLKELKTDDFIYLDPPYIGRNAGYYNSWEEVDADKLATSLTSLKQQFAYSMWKETSYRENSHILKHFNNYPIHLFSHFYHVGSKEDNRKGVIECLITQK